MAQAIAEQVKLMREPGQNYSRCSRDKECVRSMNG